MADYSGNFLSKLKFHLLFVCAKKTYFTQWFWRLTEDTKHPVVMKVFHHKLAKIRIILNVKAQFIFKFRLSASLKMKSLFHINFLMKKKLLKSGVFILAVIKYENES